jgi:hypothetical protein
MEVKVVVTVFLLDKNFTIQGVLDNKISWSYDRAINKATNIQVSIPRDDLGDTSKSSLLSLSQYIQIYCDGIYTIGGRITKRDYSDSTVDITAFTEEIKMESVICPAQYSRKYDGWDIADIVRDLSKGWYTQRVKSTSQWMAVVDSSNVDFSTLSNRIILTKNGSGVYNQDGYATYRFFSSDNSSFSSWDRIRWVSDNYGQTDNGKIELVNTTVQYRYGATTESLGSWSTPVVGAMPDTLGLDISLLDAHVLEVRINLHTDDITSEDQNGVAVGSSPVVFALEVISRTASYIGTSNVPASTGVQADGLIADEDSAFSILNSVCEIADWEFEVYNNDIYLANRLGNDLTESFVFKRDENVRITQLSDTDDELANIIHANGKGDGINKLTVTLKDTESIDTFGEYPIVKSFDTEDLAELTSLAQAYIDEHSFPVFDWRVDTFDRIDSTITSNVTSEGALAFHRLYSNSTFSTPSHNLIEQNLFFYKPVYMAGDTIRIVDPRTGTIIDSRILEEKRRGDSSGIKVSLYLNKARTSLVDRIPKPVEPLTISAPASISVRPMLGGVVVTVSAPAERYKWSETELYMSEESPVPMETPIKVARDTSFAISGLHSDKRYYFTARYVEFSGRASQASGEVSCIPGGISVDEFEVITAFGMKMNNPSNGHVTLCGTGIDNVLQDADGVIRAPSGDELLTVPNVSVNCTAPVFKSIGIDMDAWTYLVMSGDTVFPVYYSLADALFYNAANDEISTGVVIGKVKVGVVSSEDDSARILDTVAYTVAMELSTVAREQTQYAFKYLSQSTSPEEFEQYARNLGITDFFTTLAVWDLFAERIKVNQLQVGSGDTEEGFAFYAIDNPESGEQIIQVWADGLKIFEINPTTKNIIIGSFDTGNGIRWENDTGALAIRGAGKFTGTMDHEALTTMDAVASQVSVGFATKDAYYGQDLYNSISSLGTGGWKSASGSYGGTSFSRVAPLVTTEQTAIIVDSSVPNDGELQFVSAYTGSVRFIFEARPGMVSSGTVNLYINGVLISSTYRAAFSGATVVTVDRNVKKGDIVRCTTSGNEIYFRMYIRGIGVILDLGTDYVTLKNTSYYNKQFIVSSPISVNSNSYLNYNSAEAIIGALAALTPNRSYHTTSGSSISVSGGGAKSVTSIMRSAGSVIIETTSGTVYLSASSQDGVSGYVLSGTITIDTSEASLRTLTVLPKQDNTHSLGSLGLNLYYADLFVSSLVGMISAFASSAAPSGWLECNGQAVSRSTYSKLYSAIGTTFGSGDGSTTFNVPDLRGEFIRGWSHGRSGVDDGRTIGSFQDQSIQSHAHSYTLTGIGGSYGGSGSGGNRNYHEDATTGYAGGAETRPRNIALMYCIKY